MRTIKFRAKRDNKFIDDWIYGYYLYMKDQEKHYILTGDVSSYPVDMWHPHLAVKGFEWVEVDGNTVTQFTGVYDKNNVEIYEGDIVRYKNHKFDRVYVVRYQQEFCQFSISSNIGLETEQNLYILENSNKDYEVIGNIYDNKELLEK